jgi:F0F1-type ATP synthase assembly protein I
MTPLDLFVVMSPLVLIVPFIVGYIAGKRWGGGK